MRDDLEYGLDPLGRARFFGIYKARVVSIDDPLNKNRIKVKVPQVLGTETTGWADACMPITSMEEHDGDNPPLDLPIEIPTSVAMGHYHEVTLIEHKKVPKVGQNVWVMFEAGDPDHPVWIGVMW